MARFTPLHFLLLDLSPAIVGVGALSLPDSYRRTGWLLGSIITFTTAAVCYLSIIKLSKIRNRMNKFYHYRGLPLLSLTDMVFALAGPGIGAIVDSFVLMSHAGLMIRSSSFLSTPPHQPFTATLHFRCILLFILFLIQNVIWVAASGSAHCPRLQVGNWAEPPFLVLRRRAWGLMIVTATVAMGVMCVAIPSGVGGARKVYALRLVSPNGLFNAFRTNMMTFGPIGLFLLSDMTHSWKSRFPRAVGLILLLAATFYSFFGTSVYNALGHRMEVTSMDSYTAKDFVIIIYVVIFLPTIFTVAVSTMMVAYILQKWEGNPHWTRLGFLVATSILAAFLPEAGDILLVAGSGVSMVILPASIHLVIYGRRLGRPEVACILLFFFGFFLCTTSMVR